MASHCYNKKFPGLILAVLLMSAVQGFAPERVTPVVPSLTGKTDLSPVVLRAGDDATSNCDNTATVPEKKKLIAEAVGTFLIVQLGTASVMSSIFCDALNLGQVANVWSVAVFLGILVSQSIGGDAHLNPAVTVSMAVWRDFSWKSVLPYTLSQLLGAILGSLVNLGVYASRISKFEAHASIIRSSSAGVASAAAFGEYFDGSILGAFGAEAVGTGILAMVIFSLTHPKNRILTGDDSSKTNAWMIPMSISLTVGALIRMIAPLTQAGFNPARDFGPRIVAYIAGWRHVAFRHAWLYIAAPIAGAVAAGWLVDKVLFSEE